MAEITVAISQEGAQALADMKKALLDAADSNIKAKEDLNKALDQTGDKLGYLKAHIESVIATTVKAISDGSDAVTELAEKLGKLAAWIQTKI